MGAELRSRLKPLNTVVLRCTGGFRGTLNRAAMMPRDSSFAHSYKLNIGNK